MYCIGICLFLSKEQKVEEAGLARTMATQFASRAPNVPEILQPMLRHMISTPIAPATVVAAPNYYQKIIQHEAGQAIIDKILTKSLLQIIRGCKY